MYSQGLKWDSGGEITLKSVIVAQRGERNHNSQYFLLRAPADFLNVQAVII